MFRLRLVNSVGFSILLLGFTACHKRNQVHSEIGTPITEQQQTVALQATEDLRKQWNSNDCQAIYERAAPQFRSQSLPEWLSQCEYFHPKWGVWRKFVLEEATNCDEPGKGTACLDGIADFGTGHYDVIIAWTLANQQAKLLYWSLGQNDRPIQTMPSPSQNLFDPPLPPKPANADRAALKECKKTAIAG